ncbi:ATP synthase subunit [Paramyrothecium foliicola]|nr:ATP synthase subunit [Paramyrothecium foliicola]
MHSANSPELFFSLRRQRTARFRSCSPSPNPQPPSIDDRRLLLSAPPNPISRPPDLSEVLVPEQSVAMAPVSLARPMLRSPALRMAARRFESTTTQKATEAAKDAAAKSKEYQAKAQEGLSRVTSAAGPALAGAARGVSSALGRVGGPVGRLVGFVERQTPQVIYYSKVGLEMGKLVAQGQKISVPSVGTFQGFYQNLWQSIQNRSILRSGQNFLQSVRGLSTAQLAAGGVILAECLGFFTVGEMIGRFKLVGYHGETGAHH